MAQKINGTWQNLCDDDNVNHCPEVAKLPNGDVAIRNTERPDEVAVLSARDFELLIAKGATALSA